MQEEPSEIAVVQISRTEYVMKCYHNMVDHIPQKRTLRPWNQWESHCLHPRPHIWNSRTSGASRHKHTRELPLQQKLNLHQECDPIKIHTDLSSTDTYHICRARHFRWKWQCATEIQLLNTPHDWRRCRQAMTPLWCSSINTLCFPLKKRALALSRPELKAILALRLRGDMATPTAIALDSSFNLLLIRALVIARRGETTLEEVHVNNTYLSMIYPLNTCAKRVRCFSNVLAFTMTCCAGVLSNFKAQNDTIHILFLSFLECTGHAAWGAHWTNLF